MDSSKNSNKNLVLKTSLSFFEAESIKTILWEVALSRFMSPKFIQSLARYLSCFHHSRPCTLTFISQIQQMLESISKLSKGTKVIDIYFQE